MHSTAIIDATNKTLFDFDVYLDINIDTSGRNIESGFSQIQTKQTYVLNIQVRQVDRSLCKIDF